MGKIKGWRKESESKFSVEYRNEDAVLSNEEEGTMYLPLLSRLSLYFDYDNMWVVNLEADTSNFIPGDFSIHGQRFFTKHAGIKAMAVWMKGTTVLKDKPQNPSQDLLSKLEDYK